MATIEKRVTQDNKLTYRAKVRLKGFPVQTASFDRLTDAKRWAQQTEAAIREGRYFKASAAKKYTVANLLDRYISDVLVRKPKSIATQKPQLIWWKQELGSYLLCDLTPSIIVQTRDKLAKSTTSRNKQLSSSTVNRYMAALSHAISVAVKEWGWLDDSPMTKIAKFKEPRGRVRYLSDEERDRLLQACRESANPYLYCIVVMAISTGARKMELLRLKWKDVDFKRQIIILHETKNDERRSLPLVEYALELLKQHSDKYQLNKNDYVFPSKNGLLPMDIRTPWETVLKKAELEDFRFHDLRHCAASYLAMNGASTHEIAKVLGHKTLSMVKRYSHLSDSHTAEIVARMNNKIFG